MARLSVLLFIAFSVIYVTAEEECICKDYSEEDRQKIYDYLTDLAGKKLDDEGVLPGILSPLLPCGNCLENSRKKRTVVPMKEEDSSSVELTLTQDPRCSEGHVWFLFRCISTADLYKK